MIGMLYCPVLTFLHCVLCVHTLGFIFISIYWSTWKCKKMDEKNNKRNIANALCYDYCQSKSSKLMMKKWWKMVSVYSQAVTLRLMGSQWGIMLHQINNFSTNLRWTAIKFCKGIVRMNHTDFDDLWCLHSPSAYYLLVLLFMVP